MAKIFEQRCKQLYPRDLLMSTVPTKKGGRRPVGILRRSQRFEKEKNCSSLSIDFVWVLPEFRSCGLGRQLMGVGLVAGKPKPVRLQVAGSEANTAAVGLYSSLGFEWAEDAPEKTEMVLSAERAEVATRLIAERAAARALPSLPPPRCVSASMRVEAGKVRLALKFVPAAFAPPAVIAPPALVAVKSV